MLCQTLEMGASLLYADDSEAGTLMRVLRERTDRLHKY